jgi:hypothetical protein
MPVDNQWLVERRVLLTRLSGHLTIEELAESASVGTVMIASGITPVYSLVDLTDVTGFPTKLNDLRKVLAAGSSDKLVWIIVYGIPNPLMNFIASTFAQLSRTYFKVFDTFEGAKAFVKQQDRTLDW